MSKVTSIVEKMLLGANGTGAKPRERRLRLALQPLPHFSPVAHCTSPCRCPHAYDAAPRVGLRMRGYPPGTCVRSPPPAMRTGLELVRDRGAGCAVWDRRLGTVRTKLRSATISTGFPVALAAVLLVGPWGACSCLRDRCGRQRRAPRVVQARLQCGPSRPQCHLRPGCCSKPFRPECQAGFSRVHFPAGAASCRACWSGVLRSELVLGSRCDRPDRRGCRSPGCGGAVCRRWPPPASATA